MRLALAVLTGCFATQMLVADPTALVVTMDGVVYSNVTWGTVTPSTATLFHQTGVATVPLQQLPPDIRKQFGYDPRKAQAYEESVRKAEIARVEARKKQQEAQRAQFAREEAARRAQREAESKSQSNAVTQLNFVNVARIRGVGDGMYRAFLIDAEGNRVPVAFDENGKRFLDDAIAEQEQINAVNEQRRKQAEAARGYNYSGAVVVGLTYTAIQESPPLQYTKLDPMVFTVYAVRTETSAYRLIGSQMVGKPGDVAGISW